MEDELGIDGVHRANSLWYHIEIGREREVLKRENEMNNTLLDYY